MMTVAQLHEALEDAVAEDPGMPVEVVYDSGGGHAPLQYVGFGPQECREENEEGQPRRVFFVVGEW